MAHTLENHDDLMQLVTMPKLSDDRMALRRNDGENKNCVSPSSHLLKQAFIYYQLHYKTNGAAPLDEQEIFSQCFSELQSHARMRQMPGILALGLNEDGQIFGSLWLKLQEHETRTIIVGRHTLCDLLIPDSMPSAALRHVALIVSQNGKHQIQKRAIDLHTPIGFFNAKGQQLAHLTHRGPLFLRVGESTIALLDCNPSVLNYADADSAYKHFMLKSDEGGKPSESALHSDLAKPKAAHPHGSGNNSLLQSGEMCVGQLVLEINDTSHSYKVGMQALQHGIMIGRSEQCAVSCKQNWQYKDTLSRVHALLVYSNGEIWLIDTASSNGVLFENQEIRKKRVNSADRFALGKHYCARWTQDE